MGYTCTYKSELGEILLAADEIGLTGLWFTGQKYFASTLSDEHISRETPVLSEAKEWLDVYFSGKDKKLSENQQFFLKNTHLCDIIKYIIEIIS